MTKKIKVILLDYVKGVGNKGQVVDVSVPYAQNLLIPKNLAKVADAKTINELKQKEDSIKKHHEDEIKHIREMLEKIKSQGGVKIQRQATNMNHLYDKIDEKDIVKELIMNHKIKFPDKSIKLEHKIEQIGEFIVKFDFDGIKDKFLVIVEKK